MNLTGNRAVDLVSGCIVHNKRMGRKVTEISLSKSYWRIFCDYMKSTDETLIITDKFEWNNLVVCEGSIFQLKSMTWKWETISSNLASLK